MRIAVIGGGTAGMMAAAHISHEFPEAQLVQIRDPALPSIGVGEGTNPRFSQWLTEITDLTFADLETSCGATRKIGTRFEGWGKTNACFLNRFQPSHLIGYHLDAGRLAALLRGYSKAQPLHAHVTALRHHWQGVEIQCIDQALASFDYVFDARGFSAPRHGIHRNGTSQRSTHRLPIPWIPTNTGRLYRLHDAQRANVTRAIARPHGWIFMIPLHDYTSCGYIYNDNISTSRQVEEDFSDFLHYEGVADWQFRGSRTFPNHVHVNGFDGRIFKVGNAASFLEPLEAISLSTAIVQIRKACAWIQSNDNSSPLPTECEAYNRSMRLATIYDSVFLAWHYACGSKWDTPFWRHAVNCYHNIQASPHGRHALASMDGFIAAARCIEPSLLSKNLSLEDWHQTILPLMSVYLPFGTFSELNFAQVGHGIGYFKYGLAATATSVI